MSRSLVAPFDPRVVPIAGVDAHLPAVASAVLTAPALRQRFLQPPRWQPECRRDRPLNPPSGPESGSTETPMTPAAVLLAVVQHERPTVLLTQRTAHLSSHAGQIALPGGKTDATDVDAVDTALREAQEEVGLPRQAVEVLGTLPTYATAVSGFLITPVVALVPPHMPWVPNPNEVQAIFEVPLDWLMNPAHHQRHVFAQGSTQRQWYAMPYDDAGQERYIWGVTANLLRNFYRFLIA